MPPFPPLPGKLLCAANEGLRGLRCLKEERKARKLAEEAEGVSTTTDDVQDARNKNKQYEQPGELVTLPSGASPTCSDLDRMAEVTGCTAEPTHMQVLEDHEAW
eukprot:350561-Chlamydomonas_euryale.AAC.12